MEHFDSLVLIAELALGIAGFSGVVVALGARPGIWPRVDRLRLATLLTSSLGALFLALLALSLLMLGIESANVWRASSFVLALVLLFMLTRIVPGAWKITRDTTGLLSPYSIAVFIPTVIVAALTLVAQLANTAGVLTTNAFGVLFAGLVVLLVISGTQFVRLLFMVRGAGEQ